MNKGKVHTRCIQIVAKGIDKPQSKKICIIAVAVLMSSLSMNPKVFANADPQLEGFAQIEAKNFPKCDEPRSFAEVEPRKVAA